MCWFEVKHYRWLYDTFKYRFQSTIIDCTDQFFRSMDMSSISVLKNFILNRLMSSMVDFWRERETYSNKWCIMIFTFMLSAICLNFATTPHNTHFSPCCHSYWKMQLNDIEWKLKYICEPNSHFASNSSWGFIMGMTLGTEDWMRAFERQNSK